MKKTLLMTLFAGIGLSSSAWAGACPSLDTLADYLTLPPTGCSIGNLNFSGFAYDPTGINAPTAVEVDVHAISGAESGFAFDSGWFAHSGNEQDSLIQYTVTCDGCSITDLVLKMGGYIVKGNSAVSVGETEDDGLVPGLGVEAVGGGNTIPIDSETFGPQTTLHLSKDIHIDGGTSGDQASVSSVTNLFSTNQTTMTPEPSMVLMCLGALCLLPTVRKIRRA
jgi:hypothetical protein